MAFNILCRIALILCFISLSETFQTSLRTSLSERKSVSLSFKKASDEEEITYPESGIFVNDHRAGSAVVEGSGGKLNDVSLDSLPPPPRADSNKDDDMWRSMRQNAPLWVQNTLLRDSGLLRFASEFLSFVAVPSILSEHRQALPHFLSLSDVPVWLQNHIYTVLKLNDVHDKKALVRENTFECIQYGDHPMQMAHVMKPLSFEKEDDPYHKRDRLVVFVHGGAWSSGRPWMYRLVARPLLQLNYTVAVIGYRTYPDADVRGQVKDVKRATEKILQQSPECAKNDVTIIGHSSGSHIGLLSILDEDFLRRVKIGAFVSLAGIFDIAKHFEFETGRGLEEISPMKPVCGGSATSFRRYSPTYLVGDFITKCGSRLLPKMLFLHGALDDTAPYTSSLEFIQELHKGIIDQDAEKERFEALILPEVGHVDAIMQLMVGGETRDRVLRWLSAETKSDDF